MRQNGTAVCKVLDNSLNLLKAFRRQEGVVLEADLKMRIGNIMALLVEVGPFLRRKPYPYARTLAQ